MMSEFVKPESVKEQLFRPELGELFFQDQFKNGQLVEQNLICFCEINGITNKGKIESLAKMEFDGEKVSAKPFFERQSVDLKNNYLVEDRVLRYRPAMIFELKGFMEKFVDCMIDKNTDKSELSPVLVGSLAEIENLIRLNNPTRRSFGRKILRYCSWKKMSEEDKRDYIEEEAAWSLLRWLNQVDLIGSILPDEFGKIEKALEMARSNNRGWMQLADI